MINYTNEQVLQFFKDIKYEREANHEPLPPLATERSREIDQFVTDMIQVGEHELKNDEFIRQVIESKFKNGTDIIKR